MDKLQLVWLKKRADKISDWININLIEPNNIDFLRFFYTKRIRKVGDRPYNLYMLFSSIIDNKIAKELYNQSQFDYIFQHICWNEFKIIFEEFYNIFTCNKSPIRNLLIMLYNKKYKIVKNIESSEINNVNQDIDNDNDNDGNIVMIENSNLPVLSISNNTTHIMFSRGNPDISIHQNPIYSVIQHIQTNGDSMSEYDFIKLPHKYTKEDRINMATRIKRNCVNSEKTYPSNECVVCMEKTNELLSCGHTIHKDCISKTDNTRCPLCNQEVELDMNIEKEIYTNRVKNGKDLPMIVNIPVTEADNINKIFVLYT